MKKIFLLSVILLSGFIFNAQSVGITWGPELTQPRKTTLTNIIGTDQNSFFALRYGVGLFNYNDIYLEKYSKSSLKLEYIRPIKLQGPNGKKYVFQGINILDGSILVFLSYYDKDLDRNIAYVQKMNAADGSALAPAKEIDYISATKKRNAGSFDFIVSRDSSKILILHNEPFDKYANEKFSYKALDSEGRQLWSTAIELPYKDKAFGISNYMIDSDGSVYMLASIEKEKGEKERKKPSYTYNLLSYDPATKKLREKSINLGDKFISDIAFSVYNGTITIGGFYSNKSADGIAGSFFMSMNAKTQSITATGTKDLSSEFLGEFMSKRKAEKHKELYDYNIGHLVTRSDGGAYIVAEQYYVTVVTSYNTKTGASTTTYTYHYNDIIVVSVNPDASIKWVKRIPKYQRSVNDNGFYSSYAMSVANGNLYFTYNDHPKNLNPEIKSLKSGISRKMITVVTVMDANGNIKKNPLFRSSEGRIYTRPKISRRLNDRETLLFAIKRKKFKFGIIKY